MRRNKGTGGSRPSGQNSPLISAASPSASPLVREILNEANEKPYERIWLGFLTTRIVVGLLLSVSFGLQWLFSQQILGISQYLSFWLAIAYLAAAIAARLLIRQAALLRGFSLSWAIVIGIDLLVFSALHLLRSDGINLLPLLLLPVLEAAILGSLLLALGTAALVTISILFIAWLLDLRDLGSSQLVQAAGTGVVFFILAYLANQLANRLEREEKNSRQIQELARTQAQVNQLIIDAMPSGIVVVGSEGQVFGSNPAARALLGLPASKLGAEAERLPYNNLRDLVARSFADGKAHEREVALFSAAGDVLVKARAQITGNDYADATGIVLGVLFLQDLREEQAKARSEKISSMGRMSAAVAHEIRNPLAAIAQANALLGEELTEPVPKRLSKMIRDNAARLGRIVDEVLDVARVQESNTGQSQVLALPALAQRIAADWAQQHPVGDRLALEMPAGDCNAWFDADHLRRILINLLDNALRYASEQPAAMVLRLRPLDEAWQELSVWSDGMPLEESLQKHLFEPFFSSESRSSGLGLYICRQLCDRHEAKILYRVGQYQGRSGNEFVLYLRADFSGHAAKGFDSTIL
jgi:two-component system sensor histidine kinase PilS (NtrC family)